MRYHALQTFRTFLLSGFAFFSGYILLAGLSSKKPVDKIDIRIFTPTSRDSLRLRKLDINIKRKLDGKFIEATVSENELKKIQNGGFEVAVLSSILENFSVPPPYKPLREIEKKIHNLQLRYPDILHVEKIGTTESLGQPIWGIKISDNASTNEDEPTVLFTGVHHAREPIGANICLNIINALCRKYGKDKKVTNWVNSIEIWLVPVVNPDGYKYVLENNLSFPWWRKNLKDNDGNGIFNPLYDGVDLNRNYDYNWNEGGDGKPSSWFYRGRTPFSEKETEALMKLAVRENFVMGISYHSYGESILFPWGNYKRPPDLNLIVEIASALASKISKETGRGRYSILPLNGRVGQSSIWMYGHLRVIDYIVEVGTDYFPAEERIPYILKENLKGAFYILEKVLDTGIKGHVFDIDSRLPLLAEVEVLKYSSDYVKSRKTDSKFGGFYRLLFPGTYTLAITSNRYYPKIIKNVKVAKGKMLNLEVGLHNKQKKLTNGISN